MAGQLLACSLAPSSRDVYRRALVLFTQFTSQNLNSTQYFPASAYSLVLFVTHLHHNLGLAPASIQTYMAAVMFFNKLLGFHDFSTSFIINKILRGIQRQGASNTPRSPIDLKLLHRMIQAINTSVSSPYSSFLFQAMFLLAFHAFLRIGEITVRNLSQSHTIVQLGDVQFTTLSEERPALELTLRHFKGNVNRQPVTIVIPFSTQPQFCPVLALRKYIAIRGSHPGPLFIMPPSKPIFRSQFSTFLSSILNKLSIPDCNVKPHSFRIGAATSACANGVPDSDIQRMGRWKSDAYRRYIRIPQFQSPF